MCVYIYCKCTHIQITLTIQRKTEGPLKQLNQVYILSRTIR